MCIHVFPLPADFERETRWDKMLEHNERGGIFITITWIPSSFVPPLSPFISFGEIEKQVLDERLWDYFSSSLLFFFFFSVRNTIFQFWPRYGVVRNNESIVWDFFFPLTRFALFPDVKYRGNYEPWSRIQFQYRLSPISVQSLFQYSHSSKWISQSLFISLAVIFPIFRYIYIRKSYIPDLFTDAPK